VIEELAATAPAEVKVTVPPVFATGVRIDNVLISALRDFNVQIETPLAFERLQVPYVFFIPESVASKVGTIPGTAKLLASFRVIVTVDDAIPSAMTGPVPAMVEFTATGVPAMKLTVPSALVTGEVIERVFISGVDDARVQFEIPVAFVTLQLP
jgi:hypothetical protein